MLGCAPDGIVAPPGLLTRPAQTKHSTCQRATGERTSHEPWNEDTLVVVNSTTKGLAAMTVAVANSRGWIDYDAPVAEYWPEFAQNGKEAITVRQLLSHEAGLVWIDEPLHFEDLHDLDYVAAVLSRQKPAWEPGTRHGYHAMTIGLYMQELIRALSAWMWSVSSDPERV